MPSKEQLIEENEKLQEVIVSIHDTLSSLFEYINDHIDIEFDVEEEDEESECDFCGK